MDFSELIRSELLVLIPILYAIGAVLKNSTKIKNSYIPFILTVISVIASVVYCLAVLGDTPTVTHVMLTIVQGVMLATAAIGGNQFVKQFGKIASGKDESVPESSDEIDAEANADDEAELKTDSDENQIDEP